MVTQTSDDDLILSQFFCVELGEDGNAVVIANLSHGDERAYGEVVEDVSVFRFVRNFGRHFQCGS